MFGLQDKIIVITGSNGLLGRNFVRHAGKAGALVIGLDLNTEQGKENHFKCDITWAQEVEATIEEVTQRFGQVDGRVNNAYPRTADWGKPIEEVTMDSWRKNVDLHMNSYFMCSRMI